MPPICNELHPCHAAHLKTKKTTVDGSRRLLHHRPVSGVVGISDVIPVAGCLAATAMMTFTVAFTVHRVTVTTHSALAPA